MICRLHDGAYRNIGPLRYRLELVLCRRCGWWSNESCDFAQLWFDINEDIEEILRREQL